MTTPLRAAIAVLLIASTSPTWGKDPDPTVKVVSSLPRTGGAKQSTDALVNGIKLALDEANGKAGKFKVIYSDLDDATAEDGRWSPEREARNANAAVEDDKVVAYIGPWNSGAARVSMPILNEARLLMVSPGCTHPGLTQPGGDKDEPDRYRPSKKINFLRVVPTDTVQTAGAVDLARKLKAKTVTILDDGEVYGQMMSSAFARRCKDQGIETLGTTTTLDYKAADFRDELGRIQKDQKPDLIYFGGTTQTGAPQLVKDLAALGFKCPLILTDACYENDFLRRVGADALKKVSCYLTAGGVSPEFFADKGKAFAQSYKKRFKEAPESYALFGYDAMNVVLDAIAHAGKADRAAITEAALNIKEFRSPQGKFAFDKNGDTTLKITLIFRCDGNQFKYVESYSHK